MGRHIREDARADDRRETRAILVLLGIGTVVIVTVAMLAASLGREDMRRFVSGMTAEAQGQVTSVTRISRSATLRRQDYTYAYMVEYAGEDGQTHKATSVVESRGRLHAEGDAVTVRYDPDAPDMGCLIAQDAEFLE